VKIGSPHWTISATGSPEELREWPVIDRFAIAAPMIQAPDVPLEGPGGKEPLVQLFGAAAKRLVTALVGAGAETVGRHGKSVHAIGHGRLPDCRCIELGSCQLMNVRAAWKSSRCDRSTQSDGGVDRAIAPA
jgi:hypothetical protein